MSIKKYSSGSWVTVPYRKYESATDTFTTLPQTIITDGTSIPSVNIFNGEFEQGTIYSDGTLANSNNHVRTFVDVQPNTNYAFSSTQYLYAVYAYNGNTFLERLVYHNNYTARGDVFTTPANTTKIGIVVGDMAGIVVTPSDVKKPFLYLNTGTAYEYQPYTGYVIKGNMTQSGTPTPSNPVYPTEVGEETANLSPNNTFTNTTTDTRSYLSLALQAYSDSGFLNQNLTNVTENKKAIVTLTAASGTTRLTVVHNGATQNIRIVPYFSAEAGKYTLVADVTGYNPTVAGGIVLSNIMILSGEYTLETIPPYEPTGYKIPILSNGTTYPAYLGQVQSTRQIAKYEITGLEGWISRSGSPANIFFCEKQSTNYVSNLAICSHYINQDEGSFADLQDKHFLLRVASSGDKTYLTIRDSTFPQSNEGASQLSQYLQQQYANGTPVTVWYVLATSTTGIVNEPIRKIGTYADSVTNPVTIPTSGTAQSFDVDTTLKPSEVSLTYHGWHEHSDTKYSNP